MERGRPTATRGWTPQRLARAPGGKDRRGQTTSSARRGDYRDGCDRSYELMGSPTKNWSKLLTRATNNLLTSAGPGKPPRHNLVDHRCEAALTPMLFQMGRCPLGNSLSGRARHRTAHSASLFRPGNRREGLGGSPATIRTEVPCELENDEALEAARRPFDPRIMAASWVFSHPPPEEQGDLSRIRNLKPPKPKLDSQLSPGGRNLF